MAKKDKKKTDEDGGSGEPELVKLTAVTASLPDPQDIKLNVQSLVETIRKAPSKQTPRSRSDGALFLWDLVLNDSEARQRLAGNDDFPAAAQVALRDGDVVDRSAVAALLGEVCKWPETREKLASTPNLIERLCDILDTKYELGSENASKSGTHNCSVSTWDTDTVAAKHAASVVLRALTETSELRKLTGTENPKKGKPLRMKMDVLVDGSRLLVGSSDTDSSPEGTMWKIRINCLITLHQVMDPYRNKSASRARGEAFGDCDFDREKSADSNKTSPFSTATPLSTLSVFSTILLSHTAPPEARTAAAWCLAHLSFDEKRRDVMLSCPEVTSALRNALRSRGGGKNGKEKKLLLDFPTRAGVAAAVSNLAAVDSFCDDSSSGDDASSSQGLRSEAKSLEGKLSVLKKIPKDELRPVDAETRDFCVAELRRIGGILNEALLAPNSGARRVEVQTAQRRSRVVLNTLKALGPLCRLLTPPGEAEGVESDLEEEGTVFSGDEADGNGQENGNVEPRASKPGTPMVSQTHEVIVGSAGGFDVTLETLESKPGDVKAATEDTGVAKDGEVADGEVAEGGKVAEGAPVAETTETHTKQETGQPDAQAEQKSHDEPKPGASFAIGQAEGVTFAACALRRLTLTVDAETASVISRNNTHKHLLWHLQNTKDPSLRQNCRESLRQLSCVESLKHAIAELKDAPPLASRAFAGNANAASTALDEKELHRLNRMLPGLHAMSQLRRPPETLAVTRIEAYRTHGRGVRETE